MKKVLLPTDYSENADEAIEFAIRLFDHLENGKTEFTLMHAYALPSAMPIYGQMPPTAMAPPVKEERERLEDHLEGWRERFPGKLFKSILVGGPLINALSNIIHEEDIDLVVMGTRGASGIEEVLIGSNAARAAKQLECPVLIIPGGTVFEAPGRMVFATDFQRIDNFDLLRPLRTIARAFHPEVLTLHVVETGAMPDPEKKQMQKDLHVYFGGDIPHSHHFVEGDDPTEAIQRFLREQEADWLVLVGKQRSFFESLFHRSVVRKMASHAEVPLLVLH
jgi:nucleotide-binding universal stress UspA family protein